MNRERKIRHLEKGGILASWEWSQEGWDEIARSYSSLSNSWKSIFEKFIIPIATISIAGSLTWFFVQKTSNESVQASGGLTLIDKLAMLGIMVLVILIAVWLLVLLHKHFFIKPKIGDKPLVTISNSGIRVGSSFFLFEGLIILNKIEMLNPETESGSYIINIEVNMGAMPGKITVPVPRDKISEAEKVISTLKAEKKK